MRYLPLTSVVLLLASAASAQNLYLLGGPLSAYATDASADGRVVVGYDAGTYWYWTLETGVNLIGGRPPGSGVGGSASVTNDGTRIAGNDTNIFTEKVEAAVYTIADQTWQTLGSFGSHCDAEASGGWGMSGDGTTVVGLAWEPGCQARAFRWREATGLTSLGTAFFFKPTRANATNDDGRIIVGWQDNYDGWRQAAIWTDGVQTLLTGPGGVKLPEAGAVSGNGQWVGGIGLASLGRPAWRWSVATGYQSLGPVPIAGYTGYCTAMNGDGSVATVFFRGGPPAVSGEGYLWIDGRGLVPLEDYAREQGVDVPDDVRLSLPLGISSDGRTIVGSCRTENGSSVFVLDLPRGGVPCPTDLNGDGQTASADLGILLAAWGTPDRDLDGDGVVGSSDLTILLGAWGPCP